MRVIAFTGPKGCGKDTAAQSLLHQRERTQHFIRLPMAGGVKGVCSDFFGWTQEEMDDMDFKETPRELWPGGLVIEPRKPMMDIANWLRDYCGPDIHVARWARIAESADSSNCAFVITDLRFPNEVEWIKRYKVCPLYIERPAAEEALRKKKEAGDSMANNTSESHYELMYKFAEEHGEIIRNDSDGYTLHLNVRQAVRRKLGNWIDWGKEG